VTLILEESETARAAYNVIYDSVMACYQDTLAAPGQLVDREERKLRQETTLVEVCFQRYVPR